MPRQEEDRDLVDHLPGREGLTGFGVGCRHDFRGKVIGRATGLDRPGLLGNLQNILRRQQYVGRTLVLHGAPQ